jgi:hypothetical protein
VVNRPSGTWRVSRRAPAPRCACLADRRARCRANYNRASGAQEQKTRIVRPVAESHTGSSARRAYSWRVRRARPGQPGWQTAAALQSSGQTSHRTPQAAHPRACLVGRRLRAGRIFEPKRCGTGSRNRRQLARLEARRPLQMQDAALPFLRQGKPVLYRWSPIPA